VVEVVIPVRFTDGVAPARLFEEVAVGASITPKRLPDVVDGVPVEPIAAGAAENQAAAEDSEPEKPIEFRPSRSLIETEQALGVAYRHVGDAVNDE